MSTYYELTEQTVADYVRSKTDFFSEDARLDCQEIGDGNLNLVFRLKDLNSGKSLIVKQALPYVRAAGPEWEMGIGRLEIEYRALKIQHKLTNGLVPEVYMFDPEMYCMLMEDLHDHVIMRYGLLDYESYPHFAEHITDFLVKTLLLTSDVVMDHQEKKQLLKQFINPELCEITEQLVYTEPFHVGGRNSMEDFLVDFHRRELVEDAELQREVAKLKFDFMNNAQALLHGDLHTGSIFVNKHSTKVIDAEFAFYGPMAYDVGALLANLMMNLISTHATLEDGAQKQGHVDFLLRSIKDTVDLFKEKFLRLWDDVVTDAMAKSPGFKEWYIQDVLVNSAGVAGCEMIRRTVGFAHVKDLDDIPDDRAREAAKKTNVLLAKQLIKHRDTFTTGDAYVRLCDTIAGSELGDEPAHHAG